MDDINEDYKNLKKRLKGKITEKQLDNKLGLEWFKISLLICKVKQS